MLGNTGAARTAWLGSKAVEPLLDCAPIDVLEGCVGADVLIPKEADGVLVVDLELHQALEAGVDDALALVSEQSSVRKSDFQS